ncbi:MAG: lysine biosynthesis protein [Candidatus Bathyarchaeota archaeon]|nr:lysine biosynthesis protein [Candidatus Bathyarchaeota archaeon]
MNKPLHAIVFRCPTCHENFEFDAVGEHEYVACPLCGMGYVTVKKGGKMKLETFESQPEESILA